MVGSDGLFQIQASPGYQLFAGNMRGSQQALVAQTRDGSIIILVFDRGGTLIKAAKEPLPSFLLRPDAVCGHDVDESELLDYLRKHCGFRPGPIQIREFNLPEYLMAVYRLPKFYLEFLADPNDPVFDDELRETLPDRIKQWLSDGRFVLECGNDYWLDSAGNITDS